MVSRMAKTSKISKKMIYDMKNRNGSCAARYLKVHSFAAILFPITFLLLFIYALHTKGITFSSFFALFEYGNVSPTRPIIGAISLILWIPFAFVPAFRIAFKKGCAIDIDSNYLYFFGVEYLLNDVDYIERRIILTFGVITLVLKDGRRVSYREAFIRGFRGL